MRSLVALLVVALSAGPAVQPVPASDTRSAQDAAGDVAAPARDRFAGLWRYNEEYSIDPSTGRPERNPRGGPVVTTPRPAPARERPMAGAGAASDVIGASPFAPSPRAVREHRDMVRDLMEIAETLTFTVSDEAVTMVDDLERARTYPTDGRSHEYRLGASEFRARVSWDNARLVREIEGTFGFRMRETYFLSPNARRLFIIMRVDGIARGRPSLGADRVYDRVDVEE